MKSYALTSVMKTIIIFFALMLFSAGAFANIEHDPVPLEQAQDEALKVVQGKVLEVLASDRSSNTIYEFKIQKENGTIVDVYVKARTGEVIETKIRQLGQDVAPPEDAISVNEAEDIALKYIDEMGDGFYPIVRDSELTTYAGNYAYLLKVDRDETVYDIWIDAMNGEVLKLEAR